MPNTPLRLMFHLFDNKKKQEALDEKKRECAEAVEHLLSLLHPNTRELLAKDVEKFESYVDSRDRSVPMSLLILMSKVH